MAKIEIDKADYEYCCVTLQRIEVYQVKTEILVFGLKSKVGCADLNQLLLDPRAA